MTTDDLSRAEKTILGTFGCLFVLVALSIFAVIGVVLWAIVRLVLAVTS